MRNKFDYSTYGLNDKMECGHPRFCLRHTEYNNYISEFCVATYEPKCKNHRKLKGELYKKWKNILHGLDKD